MPPEIIDAWAKEKLEQLDVDGWMVVEQQKKNIFIKI